VTDRATEGAALPSTRGESERRAGALLDAWRARALPDPAAPLDAEDVARLVPDCLAALDVEPSVGAGFSVNTVHYYRRRDVIDAPVGRTAAARYALRHVWQATAARLAGHLGLVTLAEAREAMRGADEAGLRAFLTARVADAWARSAVRRGPSTEAAPLVAPRPLPGVLAPDEEAPEPEARPAAPSEAMVVRLPGGAWCVLPAGHPALGGADAARALADALAAALTGE
jgi:hypothetical protein